MIIWKGDHYFVAKILELADSGIPIWKVLEALLILGKTEIVFDRDLCLTLMTRNRGE
jgi:hypothetical protein